MLVPLVDPAKANILLVEDSHAQGSRVKATLEQLGYLVHWTTSGIAGLKQARIERPDLVILDVVMEDMDGFAVCRWLKLHEDTRDIPVIMLTVMSEIEARVEGLQVGADDYLPKPFEDRELEARIFAALRSKAAHSELKKRNTQLEAMLHNVEALAVTDPLTGLFNRRRFTDVLRREFAISRRYHNPLSCIMVDLDRFKRINDCHGHDAGDAVLKQIGKTLGESVREVDLVTRYGGEEFAMLLPHTPTDCCVVVAERLASKIRALSFEFQSTTVSLTASFGVATTTQIDGQDPELLVRAADTALYDAKQAGRDRVVVFSGQAATAPGGPGSTRPNP